MVLLKRLILSFFILLYCCTAFSQQNKAYGIYLELGGNASFYSFNYDKEFLLREYYRMTWRAGLGVFPNEIPVTTRDYHVATPLTVNFLYGRRDHFAEISAGQMCYLSVESPPALSAVGNVGYRYQPDKGGYFFRIGFTPFLQFVPELKYYNWAGISIGYTWRKGRCPCEDGK
jgi:hypothetical protein